MKIEGTYIFSAPPTEMWDRFTKPKHLEKVIPGCEKLEEIEPGKYDIVAKIGIAAVKGTYSGHFEIVEQDPPHRCKLTGEGGGVPGFGKGDAVIELTEENGRTVVRYQGEGEVGGLVAGIGQRMITGISKMLLKQFFKKIDKELKSQGDSEENR